MDDGGLHRAKVLCQDPFFQVAVVAYQAAFVCELPRPVVGRSADAVGAQLALERQEDAVLKFLSKTGN